MFPTVDDQWLAVTVENGDDWETVTAVLRSSRTEDADAREVLARWIAGRTGLQAQEALQRAGVAAGLVQNAGHLTDQDEQLAHRECLVTMDGPMIGQQTTERHPGRWFIDGVEVPLPYGPSPYLGEHNFEVYQELLGWDAERVAMAIGDELIM